jgi:hypothetical protein
MKTLTHFRVALALFAVALFALSSCEIAPPEDPTNPDDYRNAFTGNFSFNWDYEKISLGDTVTEQASYDGVVKIAGTNQLDFEYRPGIWRRMVVDQAGLLTEPNTLGEGYSSTGTMTADEVSITVQFFSGDASSVSHITGARL